VGEKKRGKNPDGRELGVGHGKKEKTTSLKYLRVPERGTRKKNL